MTNTTQTLNRSQLEVKIEEARKTAVLSQTPESKVVKAALDSVITKLEVAQKSPKQKNEPLTEQQVLDVVQATHKEYQKSIDAFQEAITIAGTAKALAECGEKIAAIKAEQAVLAQYLPVQMSDEDIKVNVKALLEANGITDVKQAGKVVGAFNTKYPKMADGKKVLAIAQELLN